MAYVRKLPEEYRKADMPVAATFVCPDKYAKMKVSLMPALEKADATGRRIVRQRASDGTDTSVKLQFQNAAIEIRNYALLNLMLKSPSFNRRPVGFTIDKTDPTGFWRSIGWIKEKVVKASDMVFDGTQTGEFTLPKKADLKKAVKDYSKRKDEEGNEVPVEPLLVRE